MNRVERIPVPKALEADIAYFRVVHYDGTTPLTIRVAPVALPGIVFHHTNGAPALESIATPLGVQTNLPPLFLYGTGTTPSVMSFKGQPYTSVQVVFQPHALQSLLGLNATHLANTLTDLHEFAPRPLTEQLMEAPTVEIALQRLTDFLLQRLGHAPARDEIVSAALHHIHTNPGAVRVRHLLQQLHISERQFERRFRQTVGVSPQLYIRVKRFNEAMRHLRSGRFPTVGEVAYALNYYDHAHLVRDVQQFAASTPLALARGDHALYHAPTEE